MQLQLPTARNCSALTSCITVSYTANNNQVRNLLLQCIVSILFGTDNIPMCIW
jgi:hypothetical protein